MTTSAPVDDEFFDGVLGDFLDESGQLLERLNENLLRLDQSAAALAEDALVRCDGELMNEMFRAVHSLKGLSAMLGLADINDLTHRVESLFDAVRKDELPLTPEALPLMFRSVDRLSHLIELVKDPSLPEVSCGNVIVGIQRLLDSQIARPHASDGEIRLPRFVANRELKENAPAAVPRPSTTLR